MRTDRLVRMPLIQALWLLQKHIKTPLAIAPPAVVSTVPSITIITVFNAPDVNACGCVFVCASQVLDSDNDRVHPILRRHASDDNLQHNRDPSEVPQDMNVVVVIACVPTGLVNASFKQISTGG